ncbi:MAG TPA: hypothetical protein VLI42_07055, partial [Chthoniobacterales bacterium]|nr:hypothetical protein [Chthoniobacterales bacterium]
MNRLVYHETYNRIDDAIAREKEIKGWRRSKKNALVETLNPKWVDLSVELFEPLARSLAALRRLGMTKLEVAPGPPPPN